MIGGEEWILGLVNGWFICCYSGICDGDIVIGKRWGGGGARISLRRLWELGIAMVAVIETLHQAIVNFAKKLFC